MAKLMKIIRQSIGLLLEWLLILIILFVFAIRTSSFQTYLAKKATAYLSKELGTEINIDQVAIIFLDEVALDGVLVKDRANDTLIAAKSIYIGIKDWNLSKIKFHLKNLDIEDATIQLSRNEKGDFNYQFLIDHFSSERKKKKKTVHLYADRVSLKNTLFSYDDNRKVRRKEGVDYFHINASKINLTVSNFKMDGMVFRGDVTHLDCHEKSGFQLDELITSSLVSKEGIFLSNLKIKSPGSAIESKKFNMLITGYTDILSFVDSVRFDAKIDRSIVSLKEAAMFAYILNGMEDTVQLTTSISKYSKNLRLTNFDLKFGEKSQVKGTINIPDYRNVATSFLHEKLDYVYIDVNELKGLKMPKISGLEYIPIANTVKRLSYFEAEDIRLDGFTSQFVVASDIVKTSLGNVRMDNGIMFTENSSNGSYFFEKSGASEYDVKIEHFDLGKLLGSIEIGAIDGTFFLSGEAFSTSDIHFNSIEGNVNTFEYLDYPYSNIAIVQGALIDDVFTGEIDVKDDNLDMTYDGTISFKDELHLLFTVDIEEALLEKLNLTDKDIKMSSVFEIDLKGKNPNDFRGSVSVNHFVFEEGSKKVEVPELNIQITRSAAFDEFIVTSDLVNANIKGKLDVTNIASHMAKKGNSLFPGFFKNYAFKPIPENDKNNFEYSISLSNTNNVFAIFYPELTIGDGTKINGHYYGNTFDVDLNLNSPKITFQDLKFENVISKNTFDANDASSSFIIGKLTFKDSIHFDQVELTAQRIDDQISSNLIWDPDSPTASSIHWETEVKDLTHYSFVLDPSYFSIQDFKWEIANQSKLQIHNDTIEVNKFKLLRGEQSIYLNGAFSKNDSQKLNFDIKKLDLGEISTFFSDIPLAGILNMEGTISNAFYNLQYFGDAKIKDLYVKDYQVGNVSVSSKWNKAIESIVLDGNLLFKNQETFDFTGNYFPLRKDENLDFNLFFNYTDIQFANAFMAPDVLSEIKGLLYGALKVKGSIDEPKLNGSVKLVAASAKLDITGAHYGIDGEIEVDEDGFYINGIPIYDEDGNAGSVVGSIYHDNFKDFNFDLQFDLEDDAVNRDPLNPWKVLPLDRFLVMNTAYRNGDVYYGKGYATGTVNIFGYSDNIEITVNLETQKGTKINIPMYGVGEIDDKDNFIVFLDKDSTIKSLEPKIDFTGVELELNFKITPEAEVKIIFNEDLGDIITARGRGDMAIRLNNLGDVTMNGVYSVTKGAYDFAMGIIKQKFYIEEGGSVSWTGDPYDAVLNLKTYYKVNANISAVTGDNFTSGASHQEILCYLELHESLLKPTINFNIEAPRASEAEKSILTRINNDPDELNRQFFSLLLWKSFQPLAGQNGNTSSAALDLVSNQINALLAKVSTDYKLNVNMNSDQLSGNDSYEFGVSKGFLDDRLILSGSFGVENQKADETSQSSLIGDVNLEYLLNQTGTFRINIFNMSNDQSTIQTAKQGNFTQGVGLYYKEDFRTIHDFKAVQYFLDVFRKKKNKRYPIKRKRKQVPVPKSSLPKDGKLEE
ncbi:MAG: translocation/assembly module TamB domain-containing protein [Crocinitomicaceae bacterium]